MMIPPCDNIEKCWRLGQIDIFHGLEHWFGFRPHPAQRKIISGMARTTTIVAGRRFGKSKLMAALALYSALTILKYKQYIISHSQDQAKIIFDELRNMALDSPMAKDLVSTTKDFPFPEISFLSGSVIFARSTGTNEGKYLRGHNAHRIIIDESAYVKSNVIKMVIMPMLADFDGDMVHISTPLGRNHFYDLYIAGEKGEEGYASFHFDSFENPHISHSYIKRQRATMSDLQYRTEWLAEFIDDAMCVFPWTAISDAIKDFEESYERREGRQYYIGLDIAKAHDYTAIVVIDGTDQMRCRVVYTERFNGKPYSFIVERVMSLAQQFQPLRIVVDETGVGVGPTEQITSKLPIAEGFTFSMPSKISLINTLKVGLEQRRIEFSSSNAHLADELRYYEYQLNEDTNNVKMNAASGKFDDMVIALALAYQKCAVVYADANCALLPVKQQPLKTDESSVLLLGGSATSNDNGNLIAVI